MFCVTYYINLVLAEHANTATGGTTAMNHTMMVKRKGDAEVTCLRRLRRRRRRLPEVPRRSSLDGAARPLACSSSCSSTTGGGASPAEEGGGRRGGRGLEAEP